MRKISVSLAVVMLLALSAPVLTYAASILKLKYDAATGEISGIIYSDQRDISLSLDLGGQEIPVSSDVVGAVYHSSSSNIFWANVNGQIGTGLAPWNIKVRAGDESLIPASVTGSTYDFNFSPLFRAPDIYRNFQYDYYNDGTHLFLDWSPVDRGGIFGFSHYNVYDNNELVFSTRDNSMFPITERYDRLPVFPYHSFHQFQVSAVDWLGHETERSAPYMMRAPGLMKEARAEYGGAKPGTKLQPLDSIVSFTPSWDQLTGVSTDAFYLDLKFTDALDYEYNAVPYILNYSAIQASDFELVKSDGTVIPVRGLTPKNKTISLSFQQVLDSRATYTLRLSKQASGDEIALPKVNTRSAGIDLYVETLPEHAVSYRFEAFIEAFIGTFPEPPTGLRATPGDGTLSLTWNNNTEEDLAGYLVWLDGKLLTQSPIQKTSFFIDGLINGRTYHVNVAAVNKDGGRSLQSFIFPVPKVPDGSGGTEGPGGPGPGNGNGGGVTAPASTTLEPASTGPALLATLVDKDGISKTLGVVLRSENGKVKVPVAEDIKQLLLPANGELLIKDNTLVIEKDDISLAIPGQVLEQLKTLVSAAQLNTSRISVGFTPIGSTELAEDTARAASQSANTVITPSGAAFNITLSLITADGKESKLSEFSYPVTLKLKVAEGSNPNLTGIYYLNELGGMQYLGGRLSDGYLTIDVSHFSKYAVLQYDKSFTDVLAGHWASPAIKSMVAQHVATGTSDTRFSPNQPVTRAEFATFIARKLNLKAYGASDFTDVPSTKWYSDSVAAVVETGIASGQSEILFAPERPISRQEMVVMVMKAYAYKYMLPFNVGDEGIPFADQAQISTWAKPYAAAAHKLELVQGSDNKLEPNKKATRAEAVMVISKL
ncbi:S-layer homology domain-containing protein [Paenibacillus sp. NPDC057934]|uniref:S-layer homology domain-containing protein n=1 Tax=Paenibacillus sp. NPDC057934 TaxID=3346282 RepID=UPI0036D7A0A8